MDEFRLSRERDRASEIERFLEQTELSVEFEKLERTLTDEFISCGVTEDLERFRLQQAIKVVRHMKSSIHSYLSAGKVAAHEIAKLKGKPGHS